MDEERKRRLSAISKKFSAMAGQRDELLELIDEAVIVEREIITKIDDRHPDFHESDKAFGGLTRMHAVIEELDLSEAFSSLDHAYGEDEDD